MKPPSSEYLLTPLVNQLAEYTGSSIVLALDDYHVIGDSAIHTALAFVVDHLPPHVHLIVISRNDPPLPRARLRARGQLAAINLQSLISHGAPARARAAG